MDRNVPYMPAVKNLHSILDKVQHAAVPETFSYEFLRDLGFTSSNDRSILKILKYLGMVDTSGHPQSSYKDFVDYTKTKHVLAQRLKAAYGDLYISQKKAHEKSVGELKGWFKSKTGKGDAVALKMATTFKYLASYADFSKELKETPVHPEAESQVKPEQEKPKAEQTADRGAGKIGLGYRLEIHLPDNQTIEIINDLFLKTIEAAKVNSAGYCLYVHSSSMPTNTSAEAEELIAPGTRTFKNRYVELLVDYYQQLPSPSDKQYFVSFLSDRLKPSEGLRPESVVVCAALLRVGELTELAEQLGSWVDFSEPYLTCLEALAEMLRFEPDGFSDADLTEISSLSSRIGERIDFLEKREQRRRGYYFEPDQMVDKVRQLTGKLSLLAAEVPLYRYRRSILQKLSRWFPV